MRSIFYIHIYITLVIMVLNTSLLAFNIVSSVAITNSFVEAIVGDKISSLNISYVIKNENSPHHINLTYKQVQQIKNADILFLISKDFEVDILKIVNKKKTKVIFLNQAPNITLYNFDTTTFTKKIKEQDTHSHALKHGDDDDHHDVVKDYHIWLSPANVSKILTYMAIELGKITPSYANKYLKNVKVAANKIATVDNNIKKDLNLDKLKSYLFYHNAWQYLIKSYNLPYFGSIIVAEHDHHLDISLSAKKIIALEKYIDDKQIRCLFIETQFHDKTIESIAKRKSLKIIELNPLGNPQGKGGILMFTQMLQNNINKIKQCT